MEETGRLSAAAAETELKLAEATRDKALLELHKIYDLRLLELEDEIDRLRDLNSNN